jgi:nicotinic acid phosphoribosyltransferase
MGGAEADEERNRCGGLLTDLYELNMAVVYLRRGMRAAAPSASSSGSSHPTGASWSQRAWPTV